MRALRKKNKLTLRGKTKYAGSLLRTEKITREGAGLVRRKRPAPPKVKYPEPTFKKIDLSSLEV